MKRSREVDPRLKTQVFGTEIPSPLILGSGTLIEKYHEVQPFLDAGAGAVVPRSTRKVMERDRHPSPHLHETGRRGNKMMLNAEWTGADIDYWRPYLESLSDTGQVIMSVSGRDIAGCVSVCKELDAYNFSMIEVNVSCAHSNSAHGFITRNSEHISQLLSSLKDAGITTPIGIKFGHSDYIVELSNVARESGADAIVALNTYGPLLDFEIGENGIAVPVLGIAGAKGGMSGAPLFHIALTDVAEISRQVKIPVIACGGVRTAEHALKMIMAGAMAVQIYTAAHVLGQKAPQVFTKINADLVKLLEKKNIASLDDVRGNAHVLLGQETQLEPVVPELHKESCVGCDLCIPICLPNAISPIPADNKKGHVVTIDDQSCVGCGHCVAVCPTDALSQFNQE